MKQFNLQFKKDTYKVLYDVSIYEALSQTHHDVDVYVINPITKKGKIT